MCICSITCIHTSTVIAINVRTMRDAMEGKGCVEKGKILLYYSSLDACVSDMKMHVCWRVDT